MDRVARIKYTQELIYEKAKLKNKLNDIKEQIKNNEKECSQHIGIFYGKNYLSQCLICKKTLSNDTMLELAADNLVIYADKHIEEALNNPVVWQGFIENFETMFLGFCKMHPEMSDTELVAAYNELINRKQESEEKVEESKPVTKHLSNQN